MPIFIFGGVDRPRPMYREEVKFTLRHDKCAESVGGGLGRWDDWWFGDVGDVGMTGGAEKAFGELVACLVYF